MSSRLDQDREKQLQPIRADYCKQELIKRGYQITFEDKTRLEFVHKDHVVRIFPYSGWFTGKSVTDGRGINKLLEQLNPPISPDRTWEDILAEYDASLFSKFDSFYLYLKEYYQVPDKKDLP